MAPRSRSRYEPGFSNSSTSSSREAEASLQMFSSTRSYASLITVLPRSKRNQVIMVASCGLRVPSCVLVSQRATRNAQLHSEHPKPRLFHRGVVGDGKSQPEVKPRLRGIDHAV